MAKRGTKFMAPPAKTSTWRVAACGKSSGGGEGQRLEWQRLEEVTNSEGLCRMT